MIDRLSVCFELIASGGYLEDAELTIAGGYASGIVVGFGYEKAMLLGICVFSSQVRERAVVLDREAAEP
jgi:succinate-acetate transporter protein